MNNLQYRIPNEHLKMHEIHPTVKFGERVVLGIGVIIGPDVIIGDDVFIGHRCHIRHGSTIGNRTTIRTGCLVDPKCKIGNDVKIMPHAIVGGGTVLEDMVYYGPQCMTANTDRVGFHRIGDADYNPPVIKMGAVLATACVIKPGVTVGRNCVIGQLANVTKDVPDNEVWVGNPASKIRGVGEDDRVIHDQEGEKQPWPYSVDDVMGDV